MKQQNMFDEEIRLESLSKIGDPLEKLNMMIDWNAFANTLKRALKKVAKGPGGRPPFDYVMMFKILVLQRLYNMSDDQTEFQIKDRLTFMRFLGLGIGDTVPDAKTIWHFRELLIEMRLARTLFNMFERQLERQKLITHTGTIVDATFVEAPRQRNSRDENKQIKEGKIPEEWEKPENTHKLRQKDVDARWTKKNNVTFYGYKDHAKVDADSKLITDYAVTDASIHDSQCFVELLDARKDKVVYADSAYSGKPIQDKIPNFVN
jgi:IS5 family transposase